MMFRPTEHSTINHIFIFSDDSSAVTAICDQDKVSNWPQLLLQRYWLAWGISHTSSLAWCPSCSDIRGNDELTKVATALPAPLLTCYAWPKRGPKTGKPTPPQSHCSQSKRWYAGVFYCCTVIQAATRSSSHQKSSRVHVVNSKPAPTFYVTRHRYQDHCHVLEEAPTTLIYLTDERGQKPSRTLLKSLVHKHWLAFET